MLACFKEDVSYYSEADIDNLLEILVRLELSEDLSMRGKTKIFILDFGQFAQVILQLTLLELVQIVLAQDHVLNQLSDFLVEFDHVWFSVHKVLDRTPIMEQSIIVRLLRATTERVHHLAEHLSGRKS